MRNHAAIRILSISVVVITSNAEKPIRGSFLFVVLEYDALVLNGIYFGVLDIYL